MSGRKHFSFNVIKYAIEINYNPSKFTIHIILILLLTIQGTPHITKINKQMNCSLYLHEIYPAELGWFILVYKLANMLYIGA
jgi:hypothetical protein